MSECLQNKLEPVARAPICLNTYTILVSTFLHLLCGIIFLMSQGHFATGNSFVVFSTSVPQRAFLKSPQQGKTKPGRKGKAAKKAKKKKKVAKKTAKTAKKPAKKRKKSFPEKPRVKESKKKKKGAKEKVVEPVEEVKPVAAAVPPLEEVIEHPVQAEALVQEVELKAEAEPVVEEVVEPVKTEETETAEDSVESFDVVVGDEEGAEVAVSAERYIPFVQREIYRLWNPPVGVPKGTAAVLKVAVNPSGTIDDYDVVNPSGCLIFDMSIERIADKFAFDACLWGKTFTVEFRQ